MNDTEFLKAFEDCALPHSEFPHQAHVRMGWLYVRACGWDAGMTRIRDGIQRFAAANGATGKYHETITVFWARLIDAALRDSPDADDFHTFVQQHPHLLNMRLIDTHYSRDLLWSDAARQGWVEPDLKPLP